MRYSKKRQAILDCLRSTTMHPTAEWVHAQLLPAYPNLSLATVYRNLHQLKEAGAIRSIGTVDGQERFDARLSPHSHVVCSRCGAVMDVEDRPVPSQILREVEAATGYRICESSLRFTGLCARCAEAQNK